MKSNEFIPTTSSDIYMHMHVYARYVLVLFTASARAWIIFTAKTVAYVENTSQNAMTTEIIKNREGTNLL